MQLIEENHPKHIEENLLKKICTSYDEYDYTYGIFYEIELFTYNFSYPRVIKKHKEREEVKNKYQIAYCNL